MPQLTQLTSNGKLFALTETSVFFSAESDLDNSVGSVTTDLYAYDIASARLDRLTSNRSSDRFEATPTSNKIVYRQLVNASGAYQLFAYDGTTGQTRQISSSGYTSLEGFNDTTVFWKQDRNLYAYDFATRSNTLLDTNAATTQTSDANIIWSVDGDDYFFYNGVDKQTRPIADDVIANFFGTRMEGSIVYSDAGGPTGELYVYNGRQNVLKQVTGDSLAAEEILLTSAEAMVYSAKDPADFSIENLYHYDVATGKTTALTSNLSNFSDHSAEGLSGRNVAWSSNDGTDTELFLYTGAGSPIQLTNNTLIDENFVAIDGANVFWNNAVDGLQSNEGGAQRRTITQASVTPSRNLDGSNLFWTDDTNGNFGQDKVFFYNANSRSIKQAGKATFDEPSLGIRIDAVNGMNALYFDKEKGLFRYDGQRNISQQLTSTAIPDADVIGFSVAGFNGRDVVLKTQNELYFTDGSYATSDSFSFSFFDFLDGGTNNTTEGTVNITIR